MTRRQLAQASETSERYLAQIESGAGNPSVSVLRAIAQALDLPTAALLPETGARTAALGAILDLLAQVPESELPALAKGSRRASRCRSGADRARRIALVGLRGAGKSTLGRMLGAASRLAVHRARPRGRGGLRRQHSRSDRDGRHGDLPPPGAQRARARHRRARGRGHHHGRRHRLQSAKPTRCCCAAPTRSGSRRGRKSI